MHKFVLPSPAHFLFFCLLEAVATRVMKPTGDEPHSRSSQAACHCGYAASQLSVSQSPIPTEMRCDGTAVELLTACDPVTVVMNNVYNNTNLINTNQWAVSS